MRKTRLFNKRVLAMALSVSMVFASMDTYVVLAAESENLEAVEDNDYQTDGTDNMPAVSEWESELTSDADVETGAGSASEPAISDDVDSNSQSSGEEKSDTEGDLDAAVEAGSSDDSDSEENSNSLTDETKIDEEIDNLESREDESVTSDIDEASEDEAQLLTDENTAEIINSGKINDITWTIDKDGLLTITGTGDYISDGVDTPPWADASAVLSAVVNISGITTTENMFSRCRNLRNVDLLNLDTSNVTNMSYMFLGCSKMSNLDLSSFDTHNVKDMRNMFSGCDSLSNLDLSSFDTSNATSMGAMFYGCNSLTSLDLSSFDTHNVKDMHSMFYGCNSLTSLDLNSFDTSNVTNMSYMFYGCNSLTSLDLNSFDKSNVTSMSYMFAFCSNMTSLNLNSFDTSNVTNMSYMFYGCNSLTSLDLNSFDTSNVTNMSYMFYGYSLSNLDLSSFDTSNVMTMECMFYNCSSLSNLDLSSFDTSNVTNMSYMFYGCSSLISLDLSSFDTSNATSMSYMFSICNSLSCIVTPKNCRASVILPGTWYQDAETTYKTLPEGLNYSIVLYKDGYPGDGKTKQVVFISGISMSSKEYDGTSNPYAGTIVVKDSAGNTITDVTTTYSYTGKLADGSIYPETTEAPYQIGSYKLSVVIPDNDKYIGQKTYSFSIKKRTVTITAPSVSIEFNGELPVLSNLTCTIEGLLGDDKLITAPSLKYSNENISTSTKGSYDIIPYDAEAGNIYNIKYVYGTLTIGDPDDDSNFDDDERIDLNSISGTIANIKVKTYDGNPYVPTVKVTVLENNKKKTLTEGIDYRVEYKDNVNAGSGSVIVKGNGIYKGELPKKTFEIKQKSIKKLKIIAGSMAVGDTESGVPIYVYDGSKLLQEDTDYTLSGTDNLTAKAAKSVKITITAMETSNYTGTTTAKIAVYEVSDTSKIINPDDITLKVTSDANAAEAEDLQMQYTGKAIKPVVEVKKGETTLTKKDYKVQYQNNKNAGTAYVIVTGKGAYKGKVVKSFTITPNDVEPLVITNKTIKDKTYNGKLQKPSVTVKSGTKKLKKNKDYTVTYDGNLHAGIATIIVKGKGNYEGAEEVSRTFIINPQKISKISVKGTKNTGLTVTYAKHLLKDGVDYTLEYDEASIKKNKIKVTIKAVEIEGENKDFTGSVIKTVKVE